VNQIDSAGLESLRRDGPVVLLDVRTDAEVARGMIAEAKHIPLNQLPARYAELDPQAVTVVYCQSGGRSAQACMWLGERGFAQSYNLQGGVAAWLRDGLSLTPPG
jgi:rhodanese-related sulfurtransferase